MKKFKSIICLVLANEDMVLLGKHGAGINENKWGFPSTKLCDDRPQDSAKKLLEVSTLGMMGGISSTKKLCILQGKTIHGLSVYKISIDEHLHRYITSASKYVSKCFPLGALPAGVLAWKKCKMFSFEEALAHGNLDEFTKEALEFLKTREPI
jgi:hypothetical protein